MPGGDEDQYEGCCYRLKRSTVSYFHKYLCYISNVQSDGGNKSDHVGVKNQANFFGMGVPVLLNLVCTVASGLRLQSVNFMPLVHFNFYGLLKLSGARSCYITFS